MDYFERWPEKIKEEIDWNDPATMSDAEWRRNELVHATDCELAQYPVDNSNSAETDYSEPDCPF